METQELKIEPAVGWIWTVWYQWDDCEIEAMAAVALTVEMAIEEAHFSLSVAGEDYTILGLMRDDKLER
ncbi:MAG: hypothetical protein R3D89_04100 [Sphingomonadaceae bacterium]